LKRRRDATRIIYEILLQAEEGVSKTRAVYQTNVNFRLIREYLSFLVGDGFLRIATNGEGVKMFTLTGKGNGLLELLVRLERELKAFRVFPLTSGLAMKQRVEELTTDRIIVN
jgi:predicted transcriptional regulator